MSRGANSVHLFWDNLPWFVTMLVLIGCSAFFSASEAALFSLRGPARRRMMRGSAGERMAERLMRNPDRILSAVLFWNLLVNVLYFAIATMVATRWHGHPTLSVATAVVSLLAIIFFSEMLPKSVGVLSARSVAATISMPLAIAVRILDPVMPALRTVNLLSRRLIWPGLEERPPLESRDLERAIELSELEERRVNDDKIVLHNIVQLSNLQAQEWMRPRKRLRAFRPPISIDDLRSISIPSGYLLVTDVRGDEIISAIDLAELTGGGLDRLDRFARPVAYVPWCATIGEALETLQREFADVASVVNEWGESIGIITLQDIFDAVLTEDPHRAERLLKRKTIVTLADGTWHVDGMTNLRRLNGLVDIDLPPSPNVTLAGVVQQELEQLPTVGDECRWGPFLIRVLSVNDASDLLLSVSLRDDWEHDG